MDTHQSLIDKGKTLSSYEFISYLSEMVKDTAREGELPYLLAGLDPGIFSDALRSLPPPLLSALQRDSIAEPLYYHLTQVLHQGEAMYRHLQQEIGKLQESIGNLEADSLSPDRVEELLKQIGQFHASVNHYLPILNNALQLIWKTDRIDLIDKLSTLKEQLLHLLAHTIGHPSNGETSSDGLFAALEDAYSTIYDSTLQDTDAAIEGLTRLSIWFYQDYLDLGLPLREDKTAAGKSAGEMLQGDQLNQVQQLLEKLHIGTVKQLKQAHIFSKAMLKSYIERNKHLIKQ